MVIHRLHGYSPTPWLFTDSMVIHRLHGYSPTPWLFTDPMVIHRTLFDPLAIHRPLGWSHRPLGAISTTLRTPGLDQWFPNFNNHLHPFTCIVTFAEPQLLRIAYIGLKDAGYNIGLSTKKAIFSYAHQHVPKSSFYMLEARKCPPP